MRSWLNRAGVAGVLGLLAISFAVPAPAAEITVLAGMGVVSGVSDLAPAYEKLTGHSVVVRFEQAAAMNEKINSGAPADIAALQPEQVDNFIKQGKMVAGTKTNFAQAGVGVAVKTGASRPDISTVDAFKNAMINAKSIGYSQGGSGLVAAKVMEKLGIADQLKAKTKFINGLPVAEVVAKGDVRRRNRAPADQRHHSGRRRRLHRPAAEGVAGHRPVRWRRADGIEAEGACEGLPQFHRLRGRGPAAAP